MSLDVGFTYCTGLTKQEIKLIDEKTCQNRINLILRIMLGFSALSASRPAGAIPIPGADGFPPPAPRARFRRNPNPYCRNYGIFSRAVTGTNTELQANSDPNNSPTYYDASLNCTFEKKQIQKKFKHASILEFQAIIV